MGYFTIDAENATSSEGSQSAEDAQSVNTEGENTGRTSFFRKELLDNLPAVNETEFIRHVRLPKPLRILMDGKKQLGVVIIDET